MIEQRLFVLEQKIMTSIELMRLGQIKIRSQQIGQSGATEPFSM